MQYISIQTIFMTVNHEGGDRRIMTSLSDFQLSSYYSNNTMQSTHTHKHTLLVRIEPITSVEFLISLLLVDCFYKDGVLVHYIFRLFLLLSSSHLAILLLPT